MSDGMCPASCGAEYLDYCSICRGRFPFFDGCCAACGTKKGEGFPLPLIPDEFSTIPADEQ